MPSVILDSISFSTPDGRPLFDRLTLALGRERTGLVGRNSCGKSTLLRLISGETEPAQGNVHRSGTIGVLAQHIDERLNVAQALGVAEVRETCVPPLITSPLGRPRSRKWPASARLVVHEFEAPIPPKRT